MVLAVHSIASDFRKLDRMASTRALWRLTNTIESVDSEHTSPDVYTRNDYGLVRKELELLTGQIMDALSRPLTEESLALVRSHGASSFELRIFGQLDEPLQELNDLDEHLTNWQAYREIWPSWKFETKAVTSVVGSAGRHATVWVTVAGGHPSQQCERLEAICAVHWRREHGRWVRSVTQKAWPR